MENIPFEQLNGILDECIQELLIRDLPLLQYDVSERAITHKLAEYLQVRIPFLSVDCEYNRDRTQGDRAPKAVKLLESYTKEIIESVSDPDERRTVHSYPDIIVHERGTNDRNLLIVEVKKKNSLVSPNHDIMKLKAFTENNEHNPYHFTFGVFIVLNTGKEQPGETERRWFENGRAK